MEACQAAGFRPRIALETDSMASLFVHVATTEMVGHVIPMTRRMPHEGVVFTEIDPPSAFVSEMQVAWRRNEPHGALIGELVNELATTKGSPR